MKGEQEPDMLAADLTGSGITHSFLSTLSLLLAKI